MVKPTNEKGICQCAKQIVFSPARSAIELGAGNDVISGVLTSVHQCNRHGSVSDYLAVALPQMNQGRICMLTGFEVVVFGSDTSLSSLLNAKGIKTLLNRKMLMSVDTEDAYLEPGLSGTAYVRNRSCEKYTAGWIRREKARALRRGKPWTDPTIVRAHTNDILTLHFGSKVLHVEQQAGVMNDSFLRVSSYGFSSAAKDAAAILPVVPTYAFDVKEAV